MLKKLISNKIKFSENDPFTFIIGSNPSSGARSPILWNKAFETFKLNLKMYPADILDENIKLGIDDGAIISQKFQENNKHLNFIYGIGIDTINSFFKLDSRLNHTLSEPIFKILKGNRLINNYATFLSN